MIKLTSNICPLCKKELLSIGNTIQCPELICLTPLQDGGLYLTHYQIEIATPELIEHALIPPYAVETYASDCRTRIFKWDPSYSGNSYRIGHWIFVMETEQIHLDNPEKLIKRIQLLVPFS